MDKLPTPPSGLRTSVNSRNNPNTDDDDDDDDDDASNSFEQSQSSSSHSCVSDYSRGTKKSESNRSSAHSDAIVDSLANVVGRWRTCVVIMLLITAVLVVSTTYVFLSNSEEAQFQKSFEKSAESIKDSVEFHATNAVQTFENLADGITSEALTANATWPFFTSDNFEVKAAHARLNAFAECVFFMPLVLGKQRTEWEAYSRQQAAKWMAQSDVLGVETAEWLKDSPYYIHPDEEGKESAVDNDEQRQRQLQQRKITTFVMIDEGTPANKSNQDETTTSGTNSYWTAPSRTTATNSGWVSTRTPTNTSSTTAPTEYLYLEETTPPSQNPDYTIAEEIFLKGEDLPGGKEGDITTISESWRAYYAPVWQLSPPPKDPALVNYNILADATSVGTFNAIKVTGNKAIVSELLKTSSIDFFYDGLMTPDAHWGYHMSSKDATADSPANVGSRTPGAFPHSSTIAPIRGNFEPNAPIVGFVLGVAPWDLYLSRLLPEGTNGVYAVLSNSCAQVVTYRINGPTAVFLGEGDLHQTKYDNSKETLSFTGFGISTEDSRRAGQCDYFLALYASDEYRSEYDDNKPAVFAAILAAVFVVTGVVFFIFAAYVQQRQQKVMATALRTNAIVSSLFPANVRDRILKDAEQQIDNKNEAAAPKPKSDMQNLKKYLSEAKEGAAKSYAEYTAEDGESDVHVNVFGSKPIADLFPETTLMFADLVGFTAWSSMREPSQVFTLLETIYHSFDQLANKRRVFKVETVGDCYVAVTGVPEPRKDHAVIMCRFAKDCLDKLHPMLKKLEVVLGPDTCDLSMRFGLHSGPVTAGVLRGERARFQLFGDTMNTCSRIETTGRTGMIHISQQTAELLKAAGKDSWVVPRKDKVMAKGKGELQTYWLFFKQTGDNISNSSGHSQQSDNSGERNVDEPAQEAAQSDVGPLQPIGVDGTINRHAKLSKKASRLVDWNVDILSRLLQQIVGRRQSLGGRTLRGAELDPIEREVMQGNQGIVLEEVKEIIVLPKYDNTEAMRREKVDYRDIELPQQVTDQLKKYVGIIASLYRDVPFHNFEHASHVTMSVVKLMSRIVAPKEDADSTFFSKDHTYGIASDPLTQFAVVMSALIHDVDHVGVPNVQLVNEKVAICERYRNQSIAEQNSVDMSWRLLMDPEFQDLRATIYSSTEELTRFRQLVVNTVLATDIVDKELKELRNARWDRAFHQKEPEQALSTVGGAGKNKRRTSLFNDEATNRKATIVIEHIIQASDIAHTMQHWHIYRKWNERFFVENMKAYQSGRAANDPSLFWYKGEIGFFDFYIIPLAKKLEECGVFGVSSHEYLSYAQANREEWVSKGQQIVDEMKEKYAKPEKEAGNSGALKRTKSRKREKFHDETGDEN